MAGIPTYYGGMGGIANHLLDPIMIIVHPRIILSLRKPETKKIAYGSFR